MAVEGPPKVKGLTYVLLAAVENDLVASRAATDLLERVDEVQAQLAALHRLGHGNVLDVTHKTAAAKELALHDNGAYSDDLYCPSGDVGGRGT